MGALELEFRLREGYCPGKCVHWGEQPKMCSALISSGLCVQRPTSPKTSMRKVRHSSRRAQNIREQMSKRDSSEREKHKDFPREENKSRFREKSSDWETGKT